MDFDKMLTKLDNREYNSAQSFLVSEGHKMKLKNNSIALLQML